MENPFQTIEERLLGIESSLQALLAKENSQPVEKRFLSIRETAEKLGLSEITIYRNASSGKIPSKKIGSRVMIPGSFVEKL